jgi:hypothetical protein
MTGIFAADTCPPGMLCFGTSQTGIGIGYGGPIEGPVAGASGPALRFGFDRRLFVPGSSRSGQVSHGQPRPDVPMRTNN